MLILGHIKLGVLLRNDKLNKSSSFPKHSNLWNIISSLELSAFLPMVHFKHIYCNLKLLPHCERCKVNESYKDNSCFDFLNLIFIVLHSEPWKSPCHNYVSSR